MMEMKTLSSVSRSGKRKHSELVTAFDATRVPADIAYPIDITLLNQARDNLVTIIDALHEQHVDHRSKPRTFRERGAAGTRFSQSNAGSGIERCTEESANNSLS